MKKIILTSLLILFACQFASAQPAEGIPKTLLPLSLLQEIINEASGDLALQNEILIAGVNRNRLPEEYIKGYWDAAFILNKLREYGLKELQIIDLPTRGPETWDAEMAELWIVKPYKRKIADLKEIAASLCSGSSTTDTTAELIYVGPGNREDFYEGKDVKGKIVLVNGSPGGAQRMAVDKFGALGVVAYASSHPEFDPDEVGWSSIRVVEGQKKTFGFMVSTRVGNNLRDQLERGPKIEVRAIAKSQMVPYKEQMVEALIKGKDYPDEELVFTAHLYEGFAKQGANDDISGCVAILETARTLQKLMDDGKIPPLKRSVRFLFVPEISGTQAYIRKYPDIARRFFTNINEDMVGEGLIKNQSMMELIQTPASLPNYLNDVMRTLFEWVGTTQRNNERNEAYLPIWSPTGSRDPFYYVIDPYSGGSDHVVFADSGVRVPAVMLIVWPDQWYHSSGDTPDKSDSTQLKRVVFLGAAAAVFLAGGGPAEAERLIAEVSMRSFNRLGQELARAEGLVSNAETAKVQEIYKEANNIIIQAFLREEDTLASTRFFIRNDAALENLLKTKIKTIQDMRLPYYRELEQVYRSRCLKEKLIPQRIALTAEEIRLGKLLPVKTEKMKGLFDSQEFAAKRREMKDAPAYQLGRSESEVRNFIDGKRSILEIRNAVAAVTAPVPLKSVENCIKVLEKAGFVTIRQK
ncbi:MAG: M28 family peptidase [Candidatus Aminicenantes bacterium]|nr:M28 family peptidase [Candidatus Aminicenantes bacterium]